MPDSTPAARSNSTSAPAPTQATSQKAAPAPLGTTSPVPTQQLTSLAPTPNSAAPAPVLPSSVAPAPVARAEVAIAPAPTSISKPPEASAAFSTDTVVAPAPVARAEVAIAPAPVARPETPVTPVARTPDNFEVPAPRLKPASEGVVPLPYQNLLYFETLSEVVKAVERAKARVKASGGKFAWSRVSSEPEIQLASFATLTKAVFGSRPDFNADTLLDQAIDQLPTQVAASAKDQRSSLQLEGLWINFPGAADPKSETQLRIAVSIAIAAADANAGPFPANRVYLTFGDFQP